MHVKITNRIQNKSVHLYFEKYFSNDTFLVAARHGWGMEYVVAVDRDNPTSTGITFYWRYVK